MTNREILNHCDHTLLKAFASWDDIKKICDDAVKYNTASVCIPPCYIKRIRENYPSLNICTVVGFPLGYECTEAKICETKQALLDGCNEVDMVINITDVKNGDFDKVTEEIKALKAVCNSNILKVIIETCYLTEEEKIKLCKCVTDANADFIKTSTGFGSGGATIQDIKLFKENIGPDVKMKAAGGINTIEDLNAFIDEGCERIGTSRAVGLLKDQL